MDKRKLDAILELHKAQPVGHGYIDIIVSRDNYEMFIEELVENGFAIKSISWWEWCQKGKESEYGLGGPQSNYYDCWFAELPVDVDNIKTDTIYTNGDLITKIRKLIETKEITYQNEIVTFKQNYWLTPAIWLDVPENWRNKY